MRDWQRSHSQRGIPAQHERQACWYDLQAAEAYSLAWSSLRLTPAGLAFRQAKLEYLFEHGTFASPSLLLSSVNQLPTPSQASQPQAAVQTAAAQGCLGIELL